MNINIPDRLQRIVRLRQEGKTYREIGSQIGYCRDPQRPLSAERVRQMLVKARRKPTSTSNRPHRKKLNPLPKA